MIRYTGGHLRQYNRGNRSSAVVKLLAAVLVILLLVYAYDVFSDALGLKKHGDDKAVVIPQGAGINQITDILRDEKIIKHPYFFKLIAHNDSARIYQQGSHVLNREMSYESILKVISNAPSVVLPNNTVRVVIPEGFEIRQIADRLETYELIDRAAFMKEIEEGVFNYEFIKGVKRSNRLEGYLFPDTYFISKEENERDIIDKMLKRFAEVVLPLYEASPKTRTLDETVIMASIIEREAKLDEERATVAGVFYNRIKRGMLLQSCATVQYVLKERVPVLSYADTRIDSKYNTYRYAGLPAGPIAAAGEKSFIAAISPEETDYLYFVASPDGSSHVFSRTLAEHNRASAEAQKGGQWVYIPPTPPPTPKPTPTPDPEPPLMEW